MEGWAERFAGCLPAGLPPNLQVCPAASAVLLWMGPAPLKLGDLSHLLLALVEAGRRLLARVFL